MRIPAVFLDRDGTLIEDRGDLSEPSQAVFYPDTVRALRQLQAYFRLFIVTHQPGIAMGRLSASEAQKVNTHVVDVLAGHGIGITEVYCCPHQRADHCDCIKPLPYFPNKAAADYNLDLRQSFVIGDHPHDVGLAGNAEAQGVYVLSGHGWRHRSDVPAATTIVPGIREAAEWILATRQLRNFEARVPGAIAQAARLLQSGGLVAFPTETVYGLGATVFQAESVARIFEIKQRPRFDPLIVHLSDLDQIDTVVEHLPAGAAELMARFWPGPLTLVMPKHERVPDLVTAGLPAVAVRMPRHPMAQALIRATGVPLAAPSANRFGATSPTCAQHVRDHLGDRIDMLLDGGACTVGIESTIVALGKGSPLLLRPGGVPQEEIEALTGPLQTPAPGAAIAAPGMLARHYAPRTPLRLRAAVSGLEQGAGRRIGRLCFSEPPTDRQYAALEILSPAGDMREAAAGLFAALRRLDKLELELIVADSVPDEGLGKAINDRLRRAAASG